VKVTYAVDVECDRTVVVTVPRSVWDGGGASVVAAGSGLEMVGAWIEIVVSDTAGVCEGVLSSDSEGVLSGIGL
jgi:hypothetical protein